jgi:uncharacterized protein (TIGR03083 family)
MTPVEDMLGLLHRSHLRLRDALAGLDDRALAGPSYDSEWSIAQVASHLGSGAEIFVMLVEAGGHGGPAPGPEAFQPVWERWNAKTAGQQGPECLAADQHLLAVLDEMAADRREVWELEMFGARRDLAGLLRMRLAEHVVHTWDIAVAADPAAQLAGESVPALLEGLDQTAARSGKVAVPALAGPVEVVTSDPEARFALDLGDPVSLTRQPAAAAAAATVRLPAEALVRLVYGRLDPEHTPVAVRTDGVSLDVVRACFPGF